MDPWVACYQALLPWVSHRAEDALQRATRLAVEGSLTLIWNALDPARPAMDSDVHAIVAVSDAYHQGWFDAVLGADLRHLDRALWPPSLRSWLLRPPADRGRGKAFRHTVGEHLEILARFRFEPTLAMVADAERAARSATGTARQRAAAAATQILEHAWADVDRRRWDDAPWYEYLDVEERVGWAAAALGLPGLVPAEAAGLAWQVADQGRWEGWSPWTANELPARFLAEIARVVSGAVA